jgi:hypothetical protein
MSKLKRWTFKVYPTQEDYETTVEAESLDEAIDLAQENVNNNTSWIVLKKDLVNKEEIENEEKE